MKTYFLTEFFIFICFFSPALEAQQVVTGRITDATEGKPVPYATVMIANTTAGAYSDDLGNYSITVPGKGSFEIVVSHIGYNPIFHKIDEPKPFHQIDITLKVNEIEIQEVEIIAVSNSKHKQKDIDGFWNILLGEKPSKNGLEVLNPEKIHYYLNSDNVLTVSCNEPIEMVNHQMGYRIQYILQSFKHDYSEGEIEYYGFPYFEELIPQNSREKNRWEKKRKEVYLFSITHFLRALYWGQIHEEGFFIGNADSIKNRKILPVNLKDILQTKQDVVLVNIETPLFLMCISKPVTAQMIENSYREIWMSYEDFPIIELRPQQFIINSDGTYIGLLETKEIRKSITGLSTRLPVEYIE